MTGLIEFWFFVGDFMTFCGSFRFLYSFVCWLEVIELVAGNGIRGFAI